MKPTLTAIQHSDGCPFLFSVNRRCLPRGHEAFIRRKDTVWNHGWEILYDRNVSEIGPKWEQSKTYRTMDEALDAIAEQARIC